MIPLTSCRRYNTEVKYKRQAHCVYHCEYHLVLVTKYRREVFNQGVFAYFMIKLKEVNKYYPEIEFVEVNHDGDHVHMMITVPPKMSVGSVVRIIKANTSKRLKEIRFCKKHVLGHRWGMVRWVLCVDSWLKREGSKTVY